MESGYVGLLHRVQIEKRACVSCNDPTQWAFTVKWQHFDLPLCRSCATALKSALESKLNEGPRK